MRADAASHDERQRSQRQRPSVARVPGCFYRSKQSLCKRGQRRRTRQRRPARAGAGPVRSVPLMKMRKQKGVAAVELAVLLIPLIVIASGVTELGRAFFQYNALLKGTRDGVRFLTMKGPLDPAEPSTAGDVAQAKCLVVYGNEECTGPARVPELTTDMVSICDSATC